MVSTAFGQSEQQMGSLYKLIIEDDEGKTTVVPLNQGEISIGRMDGNTIRLMERNISRRHARLHRDNGAIFIEDLNSFNGVKINGERIDEKLEIKEGDLVEIGDYHLALQAAEANKDADDRAPTTTGAQAGTVPDFRLPEQILADAQGGTPNGPQPIVSPPPTDDRKNKPVLPPFPAGGGLNAPENPFFNPNASPSIAEGHAARTEQIKVGPARVSDVPRIICVSTEYAGREFALNRPEVIIGRVEDNDIVIEHRSVSRNHAKILFDGRVHKIIDLESANGILVNGEEYAITDLRKGDLIELGHVKFRFVPQDMPYVPLEEEAAAMLEAGVTPPPTTPDAKVVDPLPPTQRLDAAETVADTESPLAAPEIPPTVEMAVPPPDHNDPSTAATVTDTPLSALNVPEMFEPKVEATPSTAPTQKPRETADTLVEEPPPAPAKAREGARAKTEPKADAGRYAVADDDDDDIQPPSNTGKIVGAVALILVLLLGVGWILSSLSAPDGTADAELRRLYEKEAWSDVESYYESHEDQFRDRNVARELYKKAVRQAHSGSSKGTKTPPATTVAAKPAPEPTTPKAAEPAPEPPAAETPTEPEPVAETKPEAASAPPLPEGETTEPPPKATPVAKKRPVRRKRPKRRPPPKAKPKNDIDKARRYELEGRRALLAGDLDSAERYLKLCLQTSEYAPCHRHLGVLYATRDERKKSIRHYSRYIQLKPDAADADKVRAMIRSAGGQ